MIDVHMHALSEVKHLGFEATAHHRAAAIANGVLQIGVLDWVARKMCESHTAYLSCRQAEKPFGRTADRFARWSLKPLVRSGW